MNKLKIDEIIDHCKRKTKAYEQLNGIKELESADISNTFIREYWEHRQVAEYLEELKQYRAIGTVEECRAAMEMRRAIKPTFEMNYGDFESLFSCECGKKIVVRHDRGIMDKHNGPNFCSNCGKSWDWSDSP